MAYLRAFLLSLFLTTPAVAEQPYDLIFKQGTLDGLPQENMINYGRDVMIDGNAEYAERNTGGVELTFEADDMARLRFTQGDKYRNVGQFPATVGNPIIMYFVETVLRDVAQEAGGSPFYIRNRIKDALVQDAPVTDAMMAYDGIEVPVKQVTLMPFKDDKNREKLRGYADLALTFTMSEDVPGWYLSLEATAPGHSGEGQSYRNALTLAGMENAE